MFYDVPVSYMKEELRFRCELKLFNTRNANSIRLHCPVHSPEKHKVIDYYTSLIKYALTITSWVSISKNVRFLYESESAF